MKVSKLESKVLQLSKEVEINLKMDRIGSDQINQYKFNLYIKDKVMDII
jgi:hypothetical protein